MAPAPSRGSIDSDALAPNGTVRECVESRFECRVPTRVQVFQGKDCSRYVRRHADGFVACAFVVVVDLVRESELPAVRRQVLTQLVRDRRR